MPEIHLLSAAASGTASAKFVFGGSSKMRQSCSVQNPSARIFVKPMEIME
jgi:hypothetical protein